MSRGDGAIGLGLAALIAGGWAGLACAALFALDWTAWWPAAPLVIAVQC